VHKTVSFKFNGAELRFDLSHALFSSFDIDQGTKLLLKAVARDPVLASARRILDEGCGVGVIGLCVAKAFPDAEVILRDRDSLAVAFSERNRLANKLRGTTAWTDPETGAARLARPAPRVEWGLLGDGKEGGSYDFVLSNLPAKAGAPVLASFFARLAGRLSGSRASACAEGSATPRASALLVPGGRAGVVIVKPLADAALAWIADAGLNVVGEARGSGHNVYVVERGRGDADAEPANPAEPLALAAPNLDAYIRGESRFKLADLAYRASGFWGLPGIRYAGVRQRSRRGSRLPRLRRRDVHERPLRRRAAHRGGRRAPGDLDRQGARSEAPDRGLAGRPRPRGDAAEPGLLERAIPSGLRFGRRVERHSLGFLLLRSRRGESRHSSGARLDRLRLGAGRHSRETGRRVSRLWPANRDDSPREAKAIGRGPLEPHLPKAQERLRRRGLASRMSR
jgi:hypothetical protein